MSRLKATRYAADDELLSYCYDDAPALKTRASSYRQTPVAQPTKYVQIDDYDESPDEYVGPTADEYRRHWRRRMPNVNEAVCARRCHHKTDSVTYRAMPMVQQAPINKYDVYTFSPEHNCYLKHTTTGRLPHGPRLPTVLEHPGDLGIAYYSDDEADGCTSDAAPIYEHPPPTAPQVAYRPRRRSSPHLVQRGVVSSGSKDSIVKQRTVSSAGAIHHRHHKMPTAVATKYYRRSTASSSASLHKRPSKLCLPLACQPERAVPSAMAVAYRRHHQHHRDAPAGNRRAAAPTRSKMACYVNEYGDPATCGDSDELVQPMAAARSSKSRLHNLVASAPTNQHAGDYVNVAASHCRYDPETCASDLDTLLEQYEHLLDTKRRRALSKFHVKSVKTSNLKKDEAVLKPKMPLSVKENLKNLNLHLTSSKENVGEESDNGKTNKENANENRKGAEKGLTDDRTQDKPKQLQRKTTDKPVVEEITTEVLDKMLEDLMNCGYGTSVDKGDKDKATHDQLQETVGEATALPTAERPRHNGEDAKAPASATKVNEASQKPPKRKNSPSAVDAGREAHQKNSFNYRELSQLHPQPPQTPAGFASSTETADTSSTVQTVIHHRHRHHLHQEQQKQSAKADDKADDVGGRSSQSTQTARANLNALSKVHTDIESIMTATEYCVQADGTVATLELHRSKSYILNLIDRALSRELGTTREPRLSTIGTQVSRQMRSADTVSLTSRVDDTDSTIEGGGCGACLQQNDATDKPQSLQQHVDPCPGMRRHDATGLRNDRDARTGAIGRPSNQSGSFAAATNDTVEEPIYMKQLRQLRWGHLKHIQQEIRRLEDLERYLDSVPSYYNFSNI